MTKKTSNRIPLKSSNRHGAVRGKKTRTTIADQVKRQFGAPKPNLLRGADFSQTASWKGFG